MTTPPTAENVGTVEFTPPIAVIGVVVTSPIAENVDVENSAPPLAVILFIVFHQRQRILVL